MHMNTPTTPIVTWSTTNTNTINQMPTVTANVQMPHQATPADVEQYLLKMEFERNWFGSQEYWKRKGQEGYMTWEQAVTYCLVKPWLE